MHYQSTRECRSLDCSLSRLNGILFWRVRGLYSLSRLVNHSNGMLLSRFRGRRSLGCLEHCLNASLLEFTVHDSVRWTVQIAPSRTIFKLSSVLREEQMVSPWPLQSMSKIENRRWHINKKYGKTNDCQLPNVMQFSRRLLEKYPSFFKTGRSVHSMSRINSKLL
jgi:hypothetical protein